MQTAKYKKPIPVWIIAVIVIIAAVAIVFALGLSGLFGDFLGNTATGLMNIVTLIFTAPYQWAGANWINGLTLTVGGIVIVGVIFLMIAKRRYLVSEKVAIASGVAPGYVPRGSDLSTSSTLTYPEIVQPQEKKEEQTAT